MEDALIPRWVVILCCAVALSTCVARPMRSQNNGALLPYVAPTFFNASGAINALGFVCTTASGGNVALLTYQDNALTVANQDPIRLNALGRAVNGSTEVSIFLQANSYRISIYAPGTGNTCNGTTVGALIRQIDNVYDFAQVETGGTTTTSDCSTFTGATADVQILNCINALPSTGGIADARKITGAQTIASNFFTTKPVTVLLGVATFTETGGIHLCTKCYLIGAGPQQTIINKAANIDMISYGDQTQASLAYTRVSNMTLAGNSGLYTQNCISLTNVNYVELDHLEIFSCTLKGISVAGGNHVYIHEIKTYSNAQDGISISSVTSTGFVISSITTGNPTVITANANLQTIAYVNGSFVYITNATGCTKINGGPYAIGSATATTFTIPINTNGCGAYGANSGFVNNEFYNSYFVHITDATDDNDTVYSFSLATQPGGITDPRPHDVSLDNFSSTGSVLYGVQAKGGDRLSISNGNIVIPGTHCVNLGGSPFIVSQVTVTNVTCLNASQTQAGAGIFCNCTDSTFSGNVFIDNQGIPTMRYGIWFNQDSNNVAVGNRASGVTTAGFCTGSPTSTNVITGNSGTVQVGGC